MRPERRQSCPGIEFWANAETACASTQDDDSSRSSADRSSDNRIGGAIWPNAEANVSLLREIAQAAWPQRPSPITALGVALQMTPCRTGASRRRRTAAHGAHEKVGKRAILRCFGSGLGDHANFESTMRAKLSLHLEIARGLHVKHQAESERSRLKPSLERARPCSGGFPVDRDHRGFAERLAFACRFDFGAFFMYQVAKRDVHEGSSRRLVKSGPDSANSSQRPSWRANPFARGSKIWDQTSPETVESRRDLDFLCSHTELRNLRPEVPARAVAAQLLARHVARC